MLRHFGARQVAILDGGFQKWLAEGRPTEGREPAPRSATFDAVERDEIVTKQQLLAGYELPWGEIMATGTLIVLPTGVFALLVSGRLVQGLTMGAVK